MAGIITRISHNSTDSPRGGALHGSKDVTGTDSGSKRLLDVASGYSFIEFNLKDISVQAAAYAANDQLGVLVELSSDTANTGKWSAGDILELHQLNVIDNSTSGASIQVEFFHSTITVAANNAAYSISDTDYAKKVASGRVAFSDYISGGNGTFAIVSGFNQSFKTVGTSLFMNCKILEVATYGAVTDIRVTAIFKRV